MNPFHTAPTSHLRRESETEEKGGWNVSGSGVNKCVKERVSEETSDWFGLISQQPSDSAVEDVQLHAPLFSLDSANS